MDITAFNNLLAGLFQGIGQSGGQTPQLPPDQGTTITQPDGIQYTERPVSSEDQLKWLQLEASGNIQNPPPGLLSSGLWDPSTGPPPIEAIKTSTGPPPLEPAVQDTVQPQSLIEPSYQGPTESTPAPSNLEVTQPPPTSDSGSDSSTPTYDTITKELLAELQSGKKKNWGEALGLAAIAFSNPQLAIGMMQASERDRQQLKAMLLQAGGQEMAIKRSEKAQQAALDRQIKANENIMSRQEQSAQRTARAQIEADARDLDIPVDLSGLPWETDFEKARVDATSLVNRAKTMSVMAKEIHKFGGNLTGVELTPTPENLNKLKSHYDLYAQDAEKLQTLEKLFSSASNGFSPEVASQIMGALKTPEAQAQAGPYLMAGQQKWRDNQRILGFRESAISAARNAATSSSALVTERINKLKAEIDDIESGRINADADTARKLAADSADLIKQVTNASVGASVLGQQDPVAGGILASGNLQTSALLGTLQDVTDKAISTIGQKSRDLAAADPATAYNESLTGAFNTLLTTKDGLPRTDENGKPFISGDPKAFLYNGQNVSDPKWQTLVKDAWATYKAKIPKAKDTDFASQFLIQSQVYNSTIYNDRPLREYFKSPSDYLPQIPNILNTINPAAPVPTPAPAP